MAGSLMMSWLMMLMFSIGVTAIGWRFRRVRGGRLYFWSGVGSLILFAILFVMTTFFRETFYGWLFGWS